MCLLSGGQPTYHFSTRVRHGRDELVLSLNKHDRLDLRLWTAAGGVRMEPPTGLTLHLNDVPKLIDALQGAQLAPSGPSRLWRRLVASLLAAGSFLLGKRWVDGQVGRRVNPSPRIGAGAIREITTEDPFEMALVEDNHVIQALSADATNDAFDIGILPRAPRCAGTVIHSQTAQAFSKANSVNSIAITQ